MRAYLSIVLLSFCTSFGWGCSHYKLELFDYTGDGWSGNQYHFVDELGNTIISGTLTLADGSFSERYVCADDGCYRVKVGGNPYGNLDQIDWTLTMIEDPFDTVSGTAYGEITVQLSGGKILENACSRPPSLSNVPTRHPTSTPGPTLTPEPTPRATTCYHLESLSILGNGWNDNVLDIKSDYLFLTYTFDDGFYKEDSVCIDDGCYDFRFGGGSQLDAAGFRFVFDDKFYGEVPTSGLIGLSQGAVSMGQCTSQPSLSTPPSISPNPSPSPSVSKSPTVTFTPTNTHSPSVDACKPECYHNTCFDLILAYEDTTCENLQELGCTCANCRCPDPRPTSVPSASLKPTLTKTPTAAPTTATPTTPKPSLMPHARPPNLDSISTDDTDDEMLLSSEEGLLIVFCIAFVSVSLGLCLRDLKHKRDSAREVEIHAHQAGIVNASAKHTVEQRKNTCSAPELVNATETHINTAPEKQNSSLPVANIKEDVIEFSYI